MIFLPRKLLILLVLFSITATLLFGGAAYLVFSPLRSFSALELKLISEWFLFAALGVILLQLLIVLRITRVRSVLKKELHRIRSMSGYVSLSSQLSSKKLYELGPLLDKLFHQVSRINERQSIKMGGQSTLITFLTSNLKIPVVITDMFGKILFLSTAFEEYSDKDRPDILNTSIDNLIPNVFVQSIVEQIENKQSYKKEKKDDEAFSVYPIYNREQEIAYLLFDFHATSNLTYPPGTESPAHISEKEEYKFSFRWDQLGGLLNRFAAKKR